MRVLRLVLVYLVVIGNIFSTVWKLCFSLILLQDLLRPAKWGMNHSISSLTTHCWSHCCILPVQLWPIISKDICWSCRMRRKFTHLCVCFREEPINFLTRTNKQAARHYTSIECNQCVQSLQTLPNEKQQKIAARKVFKISCSFLRALSCLTGPNASWKPKAALFARLGRSKYIDVYKCRNTLQKSDGLKYVWGEVVAVVCFSIWKALNMISIGNFEAEDEANIEMPTYSAHKKRII